MQEIKILDAGKWLLIACLFFMSVLAEAQPIQAESDTEILTLSEAAKFLRMDTKTIARMAQTQRIPARRVDTVWRFSRSALVAWTAGDWKYRTMIDPATVVANDQPAVSSSFNGPERIVLSEAVQASIVGKGTNQQEASEATRQGDTPIGTPPGQRTAREVSLSDQRILLSPKEVTVDVGLFYSRRDNPVLLQTNSGSTLGNAEAQTWTTQLTGRYSPFVDTELFASTSYSNQRASLYNGAQRLSEATRSEAGDVGIGVRHTLLHEDVGRPEIVVGVDARIPTGDTSKSLGTSITLLKSFDPAVLFGTLAYRHTFSREFTDVTRLEPRNRMDLSLGYAFALNDTLSLNTVIINSFAQAASFQNAELRSSATTSLQLGMTARVARGIYLQPSLSFRLSGPDNGFALGLNMPITLPLE